MLLLKLPINNAFSQLTEALHQLSPQQYTRAINVLFQSTIGQHVRHIIELFQCLESGYYSGNVNYENRPRDLIIETDKEFAIKLLAGIYEQLEKPNINLIMHAGNEVSPSDGFPIQSNYYREVAYNLEHAIHHMALIRIGVMELTGITLPENFGVAHATIKFRQQCAQ